MEGLGQLKKAMTSSGIETRGLPACNIVPQPTNVTTYEHKVRRHLVCKYYVSGHFS
jgi:hypothetical protein